jgi:hypothetical protein
MSTILLRIAAAIYVFFTLGHTLGAMYQDPKEGGPAKQAVLAAMRAYHQDFQGSSRSYWDFYRGWGFYVSWTFVLFAILCWQLGSLARKNPSAARPLIATLFAISIPMCILTWTHFFITPDICATLATLLLGGALFSLAPAS